MFYIQKRFSDDHVIYKIMWKNYRTFHIVLRDYKHL